MIIPSDGVQVLVTIEPRFTYFSLMGKQQLGVNKALIMICEIFSDEKKKKLCQTVIFQNFQSEKNWLANTDHRDF